MSELAENVDGNLSFAEKSAARHAKLKAKWSSQRAEGDVVEEETASAFWGTFSGELAEAIPIVRSVLHGRSVGSARVVRRGRRRAALAGAAALP